MNGSYDRKFFEWTNRTARRSASVLLPIVNEHIRPNSVLDVGCGQGAWLAVWHELGLLDSLGIDGDYVDVNSLLVPHERFEAKDLRNAWDVGRRFDLVQSLEVAEHLPAETAKQFVDTLCQHGDVVLFSAARPGQGGEKHINERNPSYWCELFNNRGYAAFDFIRPLIRSNKRIAPFYRFNTLVFANKTGTRRVSQQLLQSRVTNIRDVDSFEGYWWRIRLALLSPLPEPLVTTLSRFQCWIALSLRRQKSRS